jgi:signal transduction histidine kinase
MRDAAKQLPVRLGDSRWPNPQPDSGLRSALSGTAHSIDDDGAQLPDCELRSARLPFAENGILPVELERRKFMEPSCAEPPTQEEEGRNSHLAGVRTGFIASAVSDIVRQNWPLQQARLQVQELAAANLRKDEFLAMLSHELRSPLSSIHHAVLLLRSQMDDARAQQRMRELIERQLGRIMRLVDDLVDVSRINNGRLHLQRERADLRGIVNNAIETLESDLNERNHRLTTELPDAPVWVQADRCRLEQVFVNLIANASRYTDAGGELTVRMYATDGEAVVRIRDSGIGIAPHVLAHIFDIFKQGNEADQRSKAGLGVGLAVVRKLVELHEGSVTAASGGLGQGSEFTVHLRVLRL